MNRIRDTYRKRKTLIDSLWVLLMMVTAVLFIVILRASKLPEYAWLEPYAYWFAWCLLMAFALLCIYHLLRSGKRKTVEDDGKEE